MTDKETEILAYCLRSIEYMWAAKIASIILDCDFRDAKKEIKEALDDIPYDMYW